MYSGDHDVRVSTTHGVRRTNHVLHGLLTLVTCGMWLPVWLCVWVWNTFAPAPRTGTVTTQRYASGRAVVGGTDYTGRMGPIGPAPELTLDEREALRRWRDEERA